MSSVHLSVSCLSRVYLGHQDNLLVERSKVCSSLNELPDQNLLGSSDKSCMSSSGAAFCPPMEHGLKPFHDKPPSLPLYPLLLLAPLSPLHPLSPLESPSLPCTPSIPCIPLYHWLPLAALPNPLFVCLHCCIVQRSHNQQLTGYERKKKTWLTGIIRRSDNQQLTVTLSVNTARCLL